MKIELDPQPYQAEALLNFTTKFVGVSGGKRSGKSRMISVCKALLLAFQHPGKPGVVASPTYGMTRRNLLPLFRELIEKWGISHLVKTDLTVRSPISIEIQIGTQISTIWLDCSIENYDRLNGMSLAWACVDETDKAPVESSKLFIEELIFRCSNPAPGKTAQINITGAPELNGYMAEFFIENASPDKKLYKWSMLENKAISDEYKETILKTIPAKKQLGWIYGEFMYNTDGLVYDEYDPEVNSTTLKLSDYKPGDKIDACWDINDGGCSVVFRLLRDGVSHIVGEWIAMKNTEAIIKRISDLKKTTEWAKVCRISCDPACTQVFSYIHGSGLPYAIMSSHPLIEYTITALNIRFGTKATDGKPKLRINQQTCPTLNKCLMRQGYINGVPDKKTKIPEAKTDISGPIDALRYLEFRDFPYNPGLNQPVKLRGF